jgi:hypothetical protein
MKLKWTFPGKRYQRLLYTILMFACPDRHSSLVQFINWIGRSKLTSVCPLRESNYYRMLRLLIKLNFWQVKTFQTNKKKFKAGGFCNTSDFFDKIRHRVVIGYILSDILFILLYKTDMLTLCHFHHFTESILHVYLRDRTRKEKFWEELIAYFPSIRHGPHRKDSSNNFLLLCVYSLVR